MYKQIIIARKDLNMSPGKLAAQVSHGSMAFLTQKIRDHACASYIRNRKTKAHEVWGYAYEDFYDKDLFEQWINGIFTKVVLEAKTKDKLLKARTMAEDLGLQEGEDFFLVYDACNTELEPEEENGSTLTCIGFKPMDADLIDQIGKKYQLYK